MSDWDWLKHGKEIATVEGGFTKEVEYTIYAHPLVYGQIEHEGLHYRVVRYTFAPRMTWGLVRCEEHPWSTTFKSKLFKNVTNVTA